VSFFVQRVAVAQSVIEPRPAGGSVEELAIALCARFCKKMKSSTTTVKERGGGGRILEAPVYKGDSSQAHIWLVIQLL